MNAGQCCWEHGYRASWGAIVRTKTIARRRIGRFVRNWRRGVADRERAIHAEVKR